MRIDPQLPSIRTAYDRAVADPSLISEDGRGTIVDADLREYKANQTVLAMDVYPALRAKVHSDELKITAFGTLPFKHDLKFHLNSIDFQ